MLGFGNFRRAQPAGETLWKDRERGNASANGLWVYWLWWLDMGLQHIAGGMAGRYWQATGGAQSEVSRGNPRPMPSGKMYSRTFWLSDWNPGKKKAPAAARDTRATAGFALFVEVGE